MDSNCIFCKIINKEIPSKLIYEDNDFFAMLDIAPATKGHVLILPKEHASTLTDLSDDKASKILVLAKKIIVAMKKVHGFTDYNIVQNNGELAGQTVSHYHLHLIPRYSKVELGLWTPHEGDPSVTDENAEAVRNLLK
ncbi:MAG: HIT family protein [Lachnospiraceae bacterium]|nr:HIT family protein [Lachnospiraceae bacterium]